MNASEAPFGRPSPRRELQGPRPAPLRVNKDSHKIKKPPTVPPPSHAEHRPPVIIYTVSPKVIHAEPADFMALVQRLTGLSSESSLPSPSAAGAFSPAASLATIEKASDSNYRCRKSADYIDDMGIVGGATTTSDRPGSFSGILSPVPSALLPISPGLFSPSVDPNALSFLHELSPAFHGNRSYIESTFLGASPRSNLLATPTVPSPGAWDLFNQFHDL